VNLYHFYDFFHRCQKKCYEDFVTCKGAEAQAGNIDAKIGMWS
jgi:hypothetical protein